MPGHDNILKGEFVTLRPLSPDDAECTFAWRQSKRASQLNEGAQTVEQQRKWIEGRPKSEYNFIIELNQPSEGTPKAVGMLSLIAVNLNHKHGESARFLIGEEAAVKGVPAAVEAMKLLYELAFDKLHLRRIYGTVSSGNPLMIKWQKFLGMQEEGRWRSHYHLQGKDEDAVCLGLLENEYRKITIPRMKGLMLAGRQSKENH